jgi:hypothetical protein
VANRWHGVSNWLVLGPPARHHELLVANRCRRQVLLRGLLISLDGEGLSQLSTFGADDWLVALSLLQDGRLQRPAGPANLWLNLSGVPALVSWAMARAAGSHRFILWG